MKQTLVIGTLFLLVACSKTAPYEPSEREERLLKGYASLVVHQESFGRTSNPDSIALYLQQTDSILDSYDFTREEFRTEFEELINSPERFEPIFQKLYSDLQKQTRK